MHRGLRRLPSGSSGTGGAKPSAALLDIHDGPFLELGLKGIAEQVIQLPRRTEDYPDRERLALQFEEFRRSA
jgi:putative restriction endonuclease